MRPLLQAAHKNSCEVKGLFVKRQLLRAGFWRQRLTLDLLNSGLLTLDSFHSSAQCVLDVIA